jgi:hypothetical protein
LLLSAALFLLWTPIADAPKPAFTDSPVASHAADSNKPATTKRDLPDAPAAKPEATTEPVEAIRFSNAPVKPAFERPTPTPRQRALWYTFMAAGHGAAAFDAYSTRRALNANAGTESDPFLRPFAHSNALYAATQVSPAVMDYLGRRMMTNRHPMLRRFWWVPQVAGASISFGAGMHNYSLVK